jgi:hypothetical protein
MLGEGPKYSDTNVPRNYTPLEKEGERIYKLELKDFLKELLEDSANWNEEYNRDFDREQLINIYKNKLASHGILV